MSSVVAKRYVKALKKSLNAKEIESAENILNKLSEAFKIDKFNDILRASDVSKQTKLDLLFSIVGEIDNKMKNFITLLVESKRVFDIPDIVKELKEQIALDKNSFEGVVFSNFQIESSKLSKLEKSLSKRLSSDISLKNEVSGYPGIKVVVDGLGVEMSFSSMRLKNDLKEHILKAL